MPAVALLGGLNLGGLLLLELALPLLGLGDLPPVVLQDATVTLLDVGALAASLMMKGSGGIEARYCSARFGCGGGHHSSPVV